MNALNKLKQEGVIKNIGVYNFTIEQLKQAQKYAKIVNHQMKLNMWAEKSPDTETLMYCQENDILVTAYKLFGRGKINHEGFSVLKELSAKYNVSEAQIIVSWVVGKEKTVAIFTSRNHLQQNMEALEIEISMEDVARLDRELLQ